MNKKQNVDDAFSKYVFRLPAMPEDNRKITEIMRKVQEGREEKKFLSTKAT